MESIFPMIRFAYSATHYWILLLSSIFYATFHCMYYLMIFTVGPISLQSPFAHFSCYYIYTLWIIVTSSICQLGCSLSLGCGAVGVPVLRKCIGETTHDSVLPCQSGIFTACLEAKSLWGLGSIASYSSWAIVSAVVFWICLSAVGLLRQQNTNS
jgi:hypothetical protein